MRIEYGENAPPVQEQLGKWVEPKEAILAAKLHDYVLTLAEAGILGQGDKKRALDRLTRRITKAMRIDWHEHEAGSPEAPK